MTATATQSAPPSDRPRGFPGLICPRCLESDCVRLHLAEVTGDGAFSCTECEEEWTLADARALVTGWSRVVAWCAMAPAIEEPGQ